MAVKLALGQQVLYPLTSPPAPPDPIPDDALIAKIVEYPDRKVWVSIPFPDTLELIAPIRNEYLVNPDVSGKSAKQIYKELDTQIIETLQQWALGDDVVGNPKKSGGKRFKAVFSIKYDPAHPFNRAFFTLYRNQNPEDDYGNWKAKLEFSPRKAGPAGLQSIVAAIGTIWAEIKVSRLIEAFEVGRVDCAIDCIGAEPLDLIARIPKAGKSIVYRSNRGRPETIYFYERKALPQVPPATLTSKKTIGPSRLTLYERTAYERQLGLPLSYGNCPVTRIELSRRWKSSRPLLSELAAIKNPFEKVAVAYAAAAPMDPKNRKGWRAFCVGTFGGGLEAAGYAVGIPQQLAFTELYQKCPGDLASASSWIDWPKGLIYVGLTEWLAEQG